MPPWGQPLVWWGERKLTRTRPGTAAHFPDSGCILRMGRPTCDNRRLCQSRFLRFRHHPTDRRPELDAAAVAAGRHLTKLFEGWTVATPDRRRLAVRIASYPAAGNSVPFKWNATAADVTEGVHVPDRYRLTSFFESQT